MISSTPKRESDDTTREDEPQVYTVQVGGGRPTFDRRTLIELAAVGSIGLAATACGSSEEPGSSTLTTGPPDSTTTTTSPPTSTAPPTTTTTTTTSTTTTTPPTTTVAPEPGTVPPGEEGVEVEIEGEQFTLPCGSPIPPNAVCTCNCVDVPSCSCVGDTCSCVGDTCSCVGDSGCAVVSHYWYPN